MHDHYHSYLNTTTLLALLTSLVGLIRASQSKDGTMRLTQETVVGSIITRNESKKELNAIRWGELMPGAWC